MNFFWAYIDFFKFLSEIFSLQMSFLLNNIFCLLKTFCGYLKLRGILFIEDLQYVFYINLRKVFDKILVKCIFAYFCSLTGPHFVWWTFDGGIPTSIQPHPIPKKLHINTFYSSTPFRICKKFSGCFSILFFFFAHNDTERGW